MGATYSFLSPLPPDALAEVERACGEAVEAYLEEHDGDDGEYALPELGAVVPTVEEAKGWYERLGAPFPAEAQRRLAACRSGLTIDRPGGFDDPLQNAILVFVAERIGEGLAFLNDVPFVLAEDVRGMLKRYGIARGFGRDAPEPKRKKPVRTRAAKAGELRAIAILDVLERAGRDVELQVDVRDALGRVDDVARRYCAMLLAGGACSDALASKQLGVPLAEVRRAADALAAELAALGST